MNMNKRIAKVAVTTALTVAFAVPAFANPFTDVPAKHWSYDAVTKLTQAGIIDGYADNTFKGDKTVTRYEMAQIVAKAMTKSLNNDQKAMVDKLSKEFATELNTMGVKMEGMQNQIDNMVKISGDARVRYTDAGDVAGKAMDLRARVSFDGKINDNLKFNARVSSSFDPRAAVQDTTVKLDTANATFNGFGFANTVGRQDLTLGSGILFDDKMTGLVAKNGNFKAYVGNTTTAERITGAEFGFNALGAKITADYLKTGENTAYAINGSAPIAKGIVATADYVKAEDAKAIAYGVKFTNLGLTVTHRDADANVYNAHSSADVVKLPTDAAIKGMEYQYDKNLGKNATLNVKYQDFDNMKARTSAAVNVKF